MEQFSQLCLTKQRPRNDGDSSWYLRLRTAAAIRIVWLFLEIKKVRRIEEMISLFAYSYSVENAYLEEKEDTCNALGEIAENSG